MKRRPTAIAAALVTVLPLAGSPARATATGALAFECTAILPAFPATSGSGVCRGDAAPSAAAGVAAGVTSDGQPFTLHGNGTFEATFDYSEGCFLAEPPAVGTASGQATVRVRATVGPVQTMAALTAEFSWTRVGLTAAVITSVTSISFDSGHSASATLPGSATAAFAPLLSQNNTCPSGGPLKAVVAGALVVGA